MTLYDNRAIVADFCFYFGLLKIPFTVIGIVTYIMQKPLWPLGAQIRVDRVLNSRSKDLEFDKVGSTIAGCHWHLYCQERRWPYTDTIFSQLYSMSLLCPGSYELSN